VNDVDLFSNIAADDESEYGIKSHDSSSTKWLIVFGARGSLVNAPPELVRGEDDHTKLTTCCISRRT
jgi:hypothetical protein